VLAHFSLLLVFILVSPKRNSFLDRLDCGISASGRLQIVLGSSIQTYANACLMAIAGEMGCMPAFGGTVARRIVVCGIGFRGTHLFSRSSGFGCENLGALSIAVFGGYGCSILFIH
jgi:hypothetical protein